MPVEIDGEPWMTWAEVRALALERAGVELGPLPGQWLLMASRTHAGKYVYPLGRIEARINHWIKTRGNDVEIALGAAAF